jgi:excisionase family DNA binding protein
VVGNDGVERAIQWLADGAGSLTLDQRLRIAALLARPAAPQVAPADVTPPPTTSITSSAATAESLVLTVEETAELLKVSRTTVYGLIRTSRLHSIMIGRLRRVRHADVVAYLDQVSADDV